MPDQTRRARQARTGVAGPNRSARREARTAALAAAQSASLQAALRPLLDRVGGHVVDADPRPGDIPIQWLGDVLFHVRLPPLAPLTAVPPEGVSTDLSDGLARLIAGVEAELGGPLHTLPRAGKQRAVRLLEERGAFEMRKSAETVAEALGLTRFTVYNYLNRSRADAP
jgi:HTH domain